MIRINSQSFTLASTLNEKNLDGSQTLTKSQTFPVQTNTQTSQRHQQQQKQLQLANKQNQINKNSTIQIQYVTERILSSILPPRISSDENEDTFNESITEFEDKYERTLIEMLEQKHGKNYRLFDLESCISTISLEKLCELCKHIDSWLGSGREKVVVLQDRGDRQRLGAAVAAYLEYQKICGSNFPRSRSFSTTAEDQRAQNTISRNWLDLDIYSMQKFLEDFAGPLRIPSHKRYLTYFSGLLSGNIKMNSSPLFLRYVSLESPPMWFNYDSLSSQSSEWRSFLKIYEGLHCVFTSDIHIIPISTRQFIYEIGNLRLRGDVTVRCYQIIINDELLNQDQRELMFSAQFHTCAVTEKEISFNRCDLDYACDDPRFPQDHRVTLNFGTDNHNLLIQSPLIRIEPATMITKFDSLENLSEAGSSHTQGPLDGSLYATILKSPKSPQISPKSNENYSNGGGSPITPVKPLRGSAQNLISPPPEFRNHKHQIEQQLNEQRYARSFSVPVNNVNNRNYEILDNKFYPKTTTTVQRYSTPTNNNNITSNKTNQIRIVETTTTTSTSSGNRNDGRDSSVRSPLTLSMDSGISSSGIVNRRLQGSSVSPSSFPSQASPQEDRHRELDDILSEMLMTVQDIPDFGSNQNTITKSQSLSKVQNKVITKNFPIQSSSSSQLANSQQHQQQENYTNTIKRSQSYNTNTITGLREENLILSSNNKDRDIYDTSSTTTTLTPPPSESGRETPIATIQANTSNSSNNNIYREKINIVDDLANMDLKKNQSYAYSQTVRSEVLVSEDDEENTGIPYHAREDSRPFSYGNIPNQSQTMLKAQSGLSSPSLVRKQLNLNNSTSTLTKKTPPRNDFEEMLRERREKVFSEKYSISDRSPNGGPIDSNKSFPSDNNNKIWYSTTSYTTNGYHNNHPHEPLKRSNTMDGSSFNRNYNTEGISGQTWLQLQQQKLRAKKEQQQKDDREHYERLVRSEVYNRPYRSRSSASQRYDGYVSDTAAFTDEVDYRRPLNYYNQPQRASDRSYHTLTTTTTTTTKERPFVQVKRAHEQAKNISGYNSEIQKQQQLNASLNVLNSSPNGHIVQAQSPNQNGTLNYNESPNSQRNGHTRLVREESFSSYRSETENETSPVGGSRPETPAFPVTPRTPSYGIGNSSPALPPKSPTSQRKDFSYSGQQNYNTLNESNYTSRRNSTTSNANSEPQEVAAHHVNFVRDSSKYWYKPKISRDEAVALLRNAQPGTFIVRDSTTFANAFGLVIKVAHPPPGVLQKGPPGDELVRHFLVEPTSRGVRLKGCANEPVFTSLSALVYQHSITPLALPCKLIIPDRDIIADYSQQPTQEQLLDQGAACNVLYLFTWETESLTGPQAVRKAVSTLFARRPLPTPTTVHFKVSRQGITLTDNTRKLFFRKHYPSNNITHCGLDPDNHMWSVPISGETPVANFPIFAFVAKRSPASADNLCHVFCQLEPHQPATAIVNYAHKAIPGSSPPPAIHAI